MDRAYSPWGCKESDTSEQLTLSERFSDFLELLQELGNAGLLYRSCLQKNLNLDEVFQKLKDDSLLVWMLLNNLLCVWLFSRSFAYLSVKDRSPQILTKAIDTLHRHKSEFFEKHGEVRIVFLRNSFVFKSNKHNKQFSVCGNGHFTWR